MLLKGMFYNHAGTFDKNEHFSSAGKFWSVVGRMLLKSELLPNEYLV